MFNTEWRILKASDYKWVKKCMVDTPITFAAIIQGLYEEYGYNIIVDIESHILWIYDDYIE